MTANQDNFLILPDKKVSAFYMKSSGLVSKRNLLVDLKEEK